MKFTEVPAAEVEKFTGTTNKVDLEPIKEHLTKLKADVKKNPAAAWQEVELETGDDAPSARAIKVRLTKAANEMGNVKIEYAANAPENKVIFHVTYKD